MRIHSMAFIFMSLAGMTPANVSLAVNSEAGRQDYVVYVDSEGVMRRSDTDAEVSYFGTNYTLPFAHAYRAAGELGNDRKAVIDNDVRHFGKLGFNGFRLHLWDVELSDSLGNLVENDHLDHLDYLIARLEKERIDIVLTAQTNFGNGYPEKNMDTGAFTYDYDKCRVHDDENAIKAQERYLEQLVSHVNPYTGRSYASDKAIIALEINNEPCHSGSRKEVTRYINNMVKAVRKGGFDRIIIYNVSHNPEVTAAYYDADIQGTTYQWYPDGLVAGHIRKGNFLPVVDNYDIPWKSTMKNYDRLARFVYEFDPGDVLYTYLYPAIARTFRKEGFQWATQFAYDPTPIAPFNTEYQTHFVNLLYTPAKALSLAVAAEAMKEVPRNADFGVYPKDTVFGDFSLSYRKDISMVNSPEKFIYTRSVDKRPVSPDRLRTISGVGSSPVVEYDGSGAYFLSRIDRGGGNPVWRLDVMPDAVLFEDPFKKPSLKKQVGGVYYRSNAMKLDLPGLSSDFNMISVGNADGIPRNVRSAGRVSDGVVRVSPGIYLLGDGLTESEAEGIVGADLESFVYVAPKSLIASGAGRPFLLHRPEANAAPSDKIKIEAEWFGENVPDSIVLYPSTVSFWSDENPTVKLKRENGIDGDLSYRYSVEIPASLTGNRFLEYNLVAFTDKGALTFPSETVGTPLDWDAAEPEYYRVRLAKEGDPVVLLRPQEKDPMLDISSVPEDWNLRIDFEDDSPVGTNAYRLASSVSDSSVLILRRYVAEDISGHPSLDRSDRLVVAIRPEDNSDIPDLAEIAFSTTDGSTYSIPILSGNVLGDGRYEFRISDFSPSAAYVVPAPFPTFLPRRIPVIESSSSPKASEIETVELRIPGQADLRLEGIWLIP